MEKEGVGLTGLSQRGDPGMRRSTPGKRCSSCAADPARALRSCSTKDIDRSGRSDEADVMLDDVTVSRRHAECSGTPDGMDAAGLGSLNGTYVNRSLIEEAGPAAGATRCRSASTGSVFLVGGASAMSAQRRPTGC